MVVKLKVLGQASPAANALTNLYTVPPGGQAVVSLISICNRHASDSLTYRIEVAPGGAAVSDQHAIFRDQTLDAKSTAILQLGIGIEAGTVLRVRTSTANASFTASGQEIT